MVWYIVIALIFSLYLELLGKLFVNKLKLFDYAIAFPFGLILLMGFCYLSTSFLTSQNCQFWIIAVIYIAFILLSCVAILKNIKKIKFSKKNTVYWAIVFLCVLFSLYFTFKTTLGDTSGYDSTYYLNMIAGNSTLGKLNTTNVYYGGAEGTISSQYSFQTYYYFVSFFLFITKRILCFANLNNISIITWIFQIIYDVFLFSLVVNTLERFCKKKIILHILTVIIFSLYYGKIYYNNIYGFYGNTFRTVAIGYSILLMYDLLHNRSALNWIAFGTSILASCSFSSSSLFTIVFILFGLYFVLPEEKYIFKYYSIILFVPLVDLLSVVTRLRFFIVVLIVLLICLLLFFLNDYLVTISSYKYTRKILLLLSFLFMFVASYKVTGNLFDFSAFFDNISENADMTINYFKFSKYNSLRNLYCICVWLYLAYMAIFGYKCRINMFMLILIIVLFNPFCCSFLNEVNFVYYRSYDIIINPFTIVFFFVQLYQRFDNKYFYLLSQIALICIFVRTIGFYGFYTPAYYHKSFIVDSDYNGVLKMNNCEYEVIEKIRKESEYLGIDPYIISPNLFTQANIPNGRYIFGREKIFNNNWSNAEKQLYTIFYPSEYLGDYYKGIDADYENVADYIREAEIDYIVIDKKQEYHDDIKNEDRYIYFLVSECGYGYSILSNDRYELFYFPR